MSNTGPNEFAVIFDMDGVIFHSNPYHVKALVTFCEKYGYTLSQDDLEKKVFGRSNKDWIRNLFEREMSPEELYEYGEEKETIFRELYEDEVVLVKGFREWIEALKTNEVPMAIATSAPQSNVDFLFRKFDIQHYFEVVLNESGITNGKPHPEIYHRAIDRLGVPNARCVVFEDSFSGIKAGQDAGAKVVAVATTHRHEELVHTEMVIDDFTTLTYDRIREIALK